MKKGFVPKKRMREIYHTYLKKLSSTAYEGIRSLIINLFTK